MLNFSIIFVCIFVYYYLMNDIENFDKQNILLSVLHLREASHLLKNKYDKISLLLLELALQLMTTSNITQQEIDEVEELKKSLKDE